MVISLIFVFTEGLQAQATADTSLQRIETRDGNEYIGRIVSENDEVIVLRTANLGEITLRKSDIRYREKVDSKRMLSGEYWSDNPQSTRYFWAPNAYGLKKGEGYYQNVWIFFNQVAVGVTDHFSIGAGMVPLFLFAGAATPMWITPKFSFPLVKDKVNISVGALAGYVVGEEDAGFGLLYGTSTFGSRDHNVSVGLGYGYAGDELGKTPAISLSGMTRISPKWYLLSENYYIGGEEDGVGIISMGARAMIGKKVGLDFGLFAPIAPDIEVFALPWLGITVPFRPKAK
jgi:hypothetical protein